MGNYDENGGGGSGISGRLIGAIIIALIALFMYWSHVQENPVTGERQHISMTPDQEIRLGLQSAPEMAHEMGGELSSDDPREEEVSYIGQYLVQHTVAAHSPWKFKFHVVNDPKTVNAFALPGGQVFITLGLLNKLQTEAQLAGVLGHEMGHVIERHTAQQMAKSQLGNMLVAAVATASYDPHSSSHYNPAVIAAVVNQMFQLKYSRHDESEADQWGVKLMSAAGFDPRAMIGLLKILKESVGSGGRMPQMFQTHPNPDLRIKQIGQYLQEHPPAAGLSEGRRLKNGVPISGSLQDEN